jgi:hypothetical protein
MSDLNVFLHDRVRLRILFGLYLTAVLVLYGITHTRWGLRSASIALCGTRYGDPVHRKTLALYGGPFERALLSGEVRAGDAVAAVRAEYDLGREVPLGRFTLIWPGQSTCGALGVLYAKDGRLVVAHSRLTFGTVVHFDTLTSDEWAELLALEQEYYRLEAAARLEAQMAVMGSAYFTDPWHLPYYVEPPPNSPVELP